MTIKDIKNISDEEFINILKKYIPKEIIDEIYNNKLTKYNKKAYIASIITLGSLLGIISIETLESILKEGVSLELTSVMLIGSMLPSYITINKLKQKELKVRKNKFNNDLKDIKASISDLSEEEFNMLVSSYEYIIDNNLDGITNSNVLDVIDKLLSINATHILQEFEMKNNLSELSIHYGDGRNDLDKAYIKGN